MRSTAQPKLRNFAYLAAVALVLWLGLPDRYIDPYHALNPHALAEFVITIMGIALLGQACVQALGHRFGLLLAGFIGGFASSTATIYTMARLSKRSAASFNSAVLGAVLSNLATLIQTLILMRLLMPSAMEFIAPLIGFAAVITLTVVALVATKLVRHSPQSMVEARTNFSATIDGNDQNQTAVIDLQSLLTLTLLVVCTSFVSAMVFAHFGPRSLPVIAAVSGLMDAHALIPALAALVEQALLSPQDAVVPILIAFTVNAGVKSLIAWQTGGRRFSAHLSLCMLAITSGLWLGYGCTLLR